MLDITSSGDILRTAKVLAYNKANLMFQKRKAKLPGQIFFIAYANPGSMASALMMTL